MKLLTAKNSRFGILVNCGQLEILNPGNRQNLLDCPDRELVCALSKDSAGIIHFTGNPKKKVQRLHSVEAEWGFLG